MTIPSRNQNSLKMRIINPKRSPIRRSPIPIQRKSRSTSCKPRIEKQKPAVLILFDPIKSRQERISLGSSPLCIVGVCECPCRYTRCGSIRVGGECTVGELFRFVVSTPYSEAEGNEGRSNGMAWDGGLGEGVSFASVLPVGCYGSCGSGWYEWMDGWMDGCYEIWFELGNVMMRSWS